MTTNSMPSTPLDAGVPPVYPFGQPPPKILSAPLRRWPMGSSMWAPRTTISTPFTWQDYKVRFHDVPRFLIVVGQSALFSVTQFFLHKSSSRLILFEHLQHVVFVRSDIIEWYTNHDVQFRTKKSSTRIRLEPDKKLLRVLEVPLAVGNTQLNTRSLIGHTTIKDEQENITGKDLAFIEVKDGFSMFFWGQSVVGRLVFLYPITLW